MSAKPLDKVGIAVARRDMQQRLFLIFRRSLHEFLVPDLDFAASSVNIVLVNALLHSCNVTRACSSKHGGSFRLNALFQALSGLLRVLLLCGGLGLL